jgi:hypothetical protein
MLPNPDREYSVVLDACALAPMPLCDTLLRCAEEPPLYQVFWSEETLEELQRTLRKFGRSEGQISNRVRMMKRAFPEASVAVDAGLLDAVPEMPHANDRHVFAAAISQNARVIVTSNLRHFPKAALLLYGVSVYSPDDFLIRLLEQDEGRIFEVLNAQASAIGQPRTRVLEGLYPVAPNFVEMVRRG